MVKGKSDPSTCIVWTEHGSWLQETGPDGAIKLSGLGKKSLGSIEAFCLAKNIRLHVRHQNCDAIIEPSAMVRA